MNEIKELEKFVGSNSICINDYNQKQYTFSINAVGEINKAIGRLSGRQLT